MLILRGVATERLLTAAVSDQTNMIVAQFDHDVKFGDRSVRDGRRYPVRLVDISATGAKFRVSAEVESALLKTRRIAISMSFPDSGHPVELYGIICHRGVAGTEIDYGIAFESESESGPRHQDAITAYVTKRRGEIMQRSTAA